LTFFSLCSFFRRFSRSVPVFSLARESRGIPFPFEGGRGFLLIVLPWIYAESLAVRYRQRRISRPVRGVFPLRYSPRERNQLRFIRRERLTFCLAFCRRPICSETSKTTSPRCHLAARVRLLSPRLLRSFLRLLAHGDREGSDFAVLSILQKGETNSDACGFL